MASHPRATIELHVLFREDVSISASQHVNISHRSISSSSHNAPPPPTGGFKRPQFPEPHARPALKLQSSGPESKLDTDRESAPRRRAEDRYQAGVDRILAAKPQDRHQDSHQAEDGDGAENGDGGPIPLSPDALTAFSNADPDAKQRNK